VFGSGPWWESAVAGLLRGDDRIKTHKAPEMELTNNTKWTCEQQRFKPPTKSRSFNEEAKKSKGLVSFFHCCRKFGLRSPSLGAQHEQGAIG